MYPLDLSVAARARRAQFSSSAILTGTKIQKPPAYDGPSVEIQKPPAYDGPSLTDHRKPAVFGFWCPLGMPNSKTVIH